jgi:hypothetical protein
LLPDGNSEAVSSGLLCARAGSSGAVTVAVWVVVPVAPVVVVVVVVVGILAWGAR